MSASSIFPCTSPKGIDEHEMGIGFFHRPTPDERGNQLMLAHSQHEHGPSIVDALLANFSLSGLAQTRFQGPLWKTLAFSVFFWDPISLFHLRAAATRFTYISWHICSICRHFRMAGPRRLRNPIVEPFHSPPSGFAHFVSANETCATCRAERNPSYAHPHIARLNTPWIEAPRCSQCNRCVLGNARQFNEHQLSCTITPRHSTFARE
jgi:hypothetical protein